MGDSASRGFAARFTDRMRSTVGTAFKVSAAGGAALFAATLAKGLGRLTAIDDARGKLIGLGHSAAGVDKIMKSALDSVQGTAFGLGDAATVAATAVAAGIKPGEELTRYLKIVADTATIAGVSLNEIGAILNKTTTSGRVFTDDLNQLADRGLPVFTWLQEEYGASATEFRKMVESGKVDSETLRRVIEENIGGAALASGNTFRGAMANIGASLGRFGAKVLTPFFETAKVIAPTIIELFDGLASRATPALKRLDAPLMRFAAWFQDLPSKIDPALAKASAAFRSLRTFVRPAVDQVRDLFSDKTIRSEASTRLATLSASFSTIASAAVAAWPSIRQIGLSLAAAAAQVGVGTWDLLVASLERLGVLAETVLVPALHDLAEFMREHPGVVKAVVAAYTAWKLGSTVVTGVKSATAAIKGLTGTLRSGLGAVRGFWKAGADGYSTLDRLKLQAGLARERVTNLGTAMRTGAQRTAAWGRSLATASGNAAKMKLASLRSGISGAATAMRTGATVALAWAKAQAAAALAASRAAAAMVAAKAKQLALTAAQKIATTVQWALNVAMSANPIVLVVTALAALGAALVLAYNKVGWFRDGVKAVGRAVSAVFGAITTAAKAVVDWFKRNWPTLLMILAGPFGLAIFLIRKHWDTIKTTVTAAVDSVKRSVDRGWAGIRTGISTAWSAITSALSNAWNSIKRQASEAVASVAGAFGGLPGRLLAAAGSIGSAAASIGATIMRKIGEGISGIAGFVGDVASKIWSSIKGFINDKLIGPIRRFRVEVFGKGFNPFGSLPMLHSGGTVDGRLSGDEVVAKLLRSETVLTADQMRAIRNGMAAGGGTTIVQINGPVGDDWSRWLARQLRTMEQSGLTLAATR